ncbi:hypothetical protein L218DRAFT_717200 [Marasmius fiardii PR-910]|nr:hypothetical protein L218DRAFT_717200 [Marasmius fiardii PR-910]
MIQMPLVPNACFLELVAFVQLFARDLSWLIAGRSVQGIGVGILSMTVPVYQCEISPGHARGKFVCIEYFCLNCGYLASASPSPNLYFTLAGALCYNVQELSHLSFSSTNSDVAFIFLSGSIALAVSLAVAGGLQLYVDRIPEGAPRHWSAEGIFCAFGVYIFILRRNMGVYTLATRSRGFPYKGSC